MALATGKYWSGSNHSSINHVIFCIYETADYEIYKDLISTFYSLVSKYNLANIYMKENLNTDFVVNVKSFKISNKLCQILPWL